MMLVETKFNIGDKVFLETDVEQVERLVTGYYIRQNDLTYGLSCGTNESWHYDFEINAEKNILITSTN